MTNMMLQGKGPRDAISAIFHDFKVGKDKSGRLVMSESAALSSASRQDCYKALEVEKYQIVETLDRETCELCSELDGNVYDFTDYRVGATASPFHPWCRGTDAPYFEDMADLGERFARDESGESYYVPRDMTFEDWKEKYTAQPLKKKTKEGIIKPAARAPAKNTGTRLIYNPQADFDIDLPEYPFAVNKGLSAASAEVAKRSGADGVEHLCLVDLTTGETQYRETSIEESVGGKGFRDFLLENNKKSFAFVHSHTTEGYFSETDTRTLLADNPVKMFIATQLDGVRYAAEQANNAPTLDFDTLYKKELAEINRQSRAGLISAGERTHLREETIVNHLIKDYTKGLIIFGEEI